MKAPHFYRHATLFLFAAGSLFPATFGVDSGRIAFSSERSGGSQIFVLTPPATNALQVTTAPGAYFWPTFSPNGSKIAFIGVHEKPDVRDIFLINPDGSGRVQITDTPAIPTGQEPPSGGVGPAAPAFHPAGDRLVYADNGRLFIIAAQSGAEAHQIPFPQSTEFSNVEEPAFSPDGSSVAFAGWTETELQPGSGIFLLNSDIYIVSTNGTNLRRLTTHPAWETTPTFHPNGSKIAFARQEDPSSGIYLISTNGGNATPVIADPQAIFISPSFSPDGTQIAYAATSLNSEFDLFSISANGGAPLNLTRNPAEDLDPSWAPAAFPLNSALAVRLNAANRSQIVFTFEAQPNRSHTIEQSSTLLNPNWQSLTNIPPQPLTRQVSITNTFRRTDPMRFFRLRTPSQ